MGKGWKVPNIGTGVVYGILGTCVVIAILVVAWLAGGHNLSTSGLPGTGAGGVQCGLNMGTSQTPQFTDSDYATGSAVSGATTALFDAGTGVQLNASQATVYGGKYQVYTTKTNYFNALQDWTSPCNQADPVIQTTQAQVASTTLSFNNAGAVPTANGNSAKQAIGANDQKTMKMVFDGPASYEYMTDPGCNKYAVTLIFTNVSEWDTGKIALEGCTSITKIQGITGDGVSFSCVGNVKDTQELVKQLTLATQTSSNPGNETIAVYVSPYVNTLSDASSGSKPMACVYEDDVHVPAATALTGSIYVS